MTLHHLHCIGSVSTCLPTLWAYLIESVIHVEELSNVIRTGAQQPVFLQVLQTLFGFLSEPTTNTARQATYIGNTKHYLMPRKYSINQQTIYHVIKHCSITFVFGGVRHSTFTKQHRHNNEAAL